MADRRSPAAGAAGSHTWLAHDAGPSGTAAEDGPSFVDLLRGHAQVRYPLDLSFYGGPVMPRVINHSIYLTAPGCSTPDCFGNPERFVRHLFRSDFVHLLDQYIEGHAPEAEEDRRWVVAAPRTIPLPAGLPTLPGGANPVLLDADLAALVSSVAAASGEAGDEHLYQVFLPPDVDVCYDSSYSDCFSPDSWPPNSPTFSWFLCAYHAAVGFGPADAPQTALYTVIPNMGYTPPPGQEPGWGCGVQPGSPNGNLIDSTANLVSREIFGAVTDPGDPYATNPGVAWMLRYPFFNEIGDDCAGAGYPSVLAFDPAGKLTNFYPTEEVHLAGAVYSIQREYSNRHHACVASADGEERHPRTPFAELYRHPSDLFPFGGPTVAAADLQPVYLTSPSCDTDACFGDPVTFLDHLAHSRFLRIASQYLGGDPKLSVLAPVRLPAPAGLPLIPDGKNPVLTDAQVQQMVGSLALAQGRTGPGTIYHLFLPADYDICFDNGYNACFAPDAPFRFGFCAYHGSFNVTDAAGNVQPILYTVQPNTGSQTPAGLQVYCHVLPGSPNGTQVDSLASALSHELFETLTDPVMPGTPNSWIAPFALGQEIGDLCNLNQVSATGVVGRGKVVPTVELAGKAYAIQSEYSNARHACVTEP